MIRIRGSLGRDALVHLELVVIHMRRVRLRYVYACLGGRSGTHDDHHVVHADNSDDDCDRNAQTRTEPRFHARSVQHVPMLTSIEPICNVAAMVTGK